ncbi:MAG: class I SAM-dependent methyltransferase [Candidatus Aminicenantes bacterium]
MSAADNFKRKGKQAVNKVLNHFYNIKFPHPWSENIDQLIEAGYRILFNRKPDKQGFRHFQKALRSGELSPRDFIEILMASDEFRENFRFENHLFSLHTSRCQFIRSLPKASQILDLGGASQHDERGALVNMGYPYKFEELIVVDLPGGEGAGQRESPSRRNTVQSELGPVRYQYHSMADLSPYPDGSFDMVFSGQSIEHVTEEEGERVMEEVYRVLKPGGYFCLDTPNGPACRLQQQGFINENHKIEYSHKQLSAKLKQAGFEICEAKGMNYMGESFQKKKFLKKEVSENIGLFSDIEHCYLLAYICRKPSI